MNEHRSNENQSQRPPSGSSQERAPEELSEALAGEAGFDLSALLQTQAESVAVSGDMYSEVERKHRKIVRRRSANRLALAGVGVAVVVVGMMALGQGMGIGQSNDDMSVAAGDTGEELSEDDASVAVGPAVNTQPWPPGFWGDSEVAAGCIGPDEGQAVVWMGPNATDGEVDSVASALQELSSVQGWRYIGKAETWAEFSSYYSDQPEILDVLTEGEMPTSFQVIFDSGEDGVMLETELAELPAVSDIQLAPDAGFCDEEESSSDAATGTVPIGPDDELSSEATDYTRCPAEGRDMVTFWMDPWTDSETLDEVDEAIRTSSPDWTVRFVDQEETMAEFLEINSDNLESLDFLSSADMPPSFIVTFDAGESQRTQRDKIASMVGVVQFTQTEHASCVGQSVFPQQLEVNATFDEDLSPIEPRKYGDVCFAIEEGHVLVRVEFVPNSTEWVDVWSYLASSSMVSSFKFVQRDEGWIDFQERHRPSTDPIYSFDTSYWPELYVVALEPAPFKEAAFKEAIVGQLGDVEVLVAEDTCLEPERLAPTRIWMNPTATPEEIAAIATNLKRSTDVRSFKLVDEDERLHTLRGCSYDYQLEWPAQLDASDMPAWFEVELEPGLMGLNLNADLELSPGVDHIDFYDSIC